MRPDEFKLRKGVPDVDVLKGVHNGQHVAVLGGGERLPADLERLPAGCVKISVNQHAERLTPVDYMVFLDNPRNAHQQDQLAAVETAPERGVKRVSPVWELTDYICGRVDYWQNGNSGTFGLWLACYMTDGPVLLAGFDCYTGKNMYFYKRPDAVAVHEFLLHRPLETHLNVWRPALVDVRVVNVGRVRAVSGPLVGLFGEY